jgi:hypothetical protein
MALQIGYVAVRSMYPGPVCFLLEHSAPKRREPPPRLSAGKGRTGPRVTKVAARILIGAKPSVERRVGMERETGHRRGDDPSD